MVKSVRNIGAGFVDMNKLHRVLVYHPRFLQVSQASGEPKEELSPPWLTGTHCLTLQQQLTHYKSTSANLSEPDPHLGLKAQTCTDTLLTFKLLTKVVEHLLERDFYRANQNYQNAGSASKSTSLFGASRTKIFI